MVQEQLTDTEFTCLSNLIREECGIDLSEEKTYLISSRLSGLVERENCADFLDLFFKARNETSGRLCSEIIDQITTNETQWFRDSGMWRVLKEYVFPELMKRAEESNEPVRILSAGCSTGQEPYSAAMMLDDLFYPSSKYSFKITGVDISAEALKVAETGRYNRIIISRGLSDEYRSRYFRQNENMWELKGTVRDMTEFRQENLLHLPEDLGVFDLVLCRNVAIYFSESFRALMFYQLFRHLKSGGSIFLGASENMFRELDTLERIKNYEYIYFRKPGA